MPPLYGARAENGLSETRIDQAQREYKARVELYHHLATDGKITEEEMANLTDLAAMVVDELAAGWRKDDGPLRVLPRTEASRKRG